MAEVRALSALNTNYDPPQPWRCVTHEAHDCDGKVIGAVGAVPVCNTGAAAEITAQVADRLRREALLSDPAVQEAMRWEQRMEARYS